MAKKKRRSSQPKQAAVTSVADDPVSEPEDSVATAELEETDTEAIDSAAEKFIGKWNRLVSTTNWEKGDIICQWRDALMTSGAAVTEYSDEAWAQLVGGVTSQHVGRLRRVYQRFGEAREEYDGLFWSHFQAALDWNDAEMWLEGAIRNEWSISQMRGKRWEALGTPPEEQKAELVAEETASVTEANTVEADEAAIADEQGEASEGENSSSLQPQPTKIVAPEGEESAEADNADTADAEANPTQAPTKRVRLQVDVEELPDDIAEAFESFKLAIIAHRREGWQETTPEAVIQCLDGLKQLALVEGEE